MADLGTLTIKNWRTFQHYGKRSAPWIKFYRGLLDDHAWGALPDASKAHLVSLWLLAVQGDGTIPCDRDWITKRISAHDPVDLQLLIRAGFLVPDADASRTLAQDASKTLAANAIVRREERVSNSLDHLRGEQPPPAGGHVPPSLMKPARVREEYLKAAGRSGKDAFLDEVDALKREAGAE